MRCEVGTAARNPTTASARKMARCISRRKSAHWQGKSDDNDPRDLSETQIRDVHAAFGSAKGTNIDKTLHTMGTFLQKRPSHTYDSHGPQIAWCTDLMLPCGDWRGSRFGSKKAEIVEEGGIMSQLYP